MASSLSLPLPPSLPPISLSHYALSLTMLSLTLCSLSAVAGQQRLPTFLAYLECTGNEDNLLQCPGSGPGTFCFSEAYVTCLGMCVCVWVCVCYDT